MKLVRFTANAGEPELGICNGTAVTALRKHVPDAPKDMCELIARWDEFRDAIAAIATFDRPIDEVELLAPIARPGKIMAIGLNYADHAAEAGITPPSEQMWFSKPGTSVNGPFAPIERPLVSHMLDYEAELVMVMGKRCRHVAKADAAKAIFGYCVGNDVSVRDWQLKTSQVTIGKSFDGHAPFGPWIVTADEVNPSDLAITAHVNGEQRQSSRTKHFIFDCGDQVALLSQAMTLEPGDLVFTGTPDGVGALMKPPHWLKSGDVVKIEIEGIGAIENRVVDERPAA